MKATLLFTLALGLAACASTGAPPTLRSTGPTVSIRDGDAWKPDGWRLAPEANPDVYQASLIDGRPHRVTFVSDVDSISFVVEEGKTYDFVIQRGDSLNHTRIVGTRFVSAAVFDAAYQAAHRGQTRIQIPEVYELVNVAIALTPTATDHRWLVYKESDYYRDVRAHFDPYAGHPFVQALEAVLASSPNDPYHALKMDGYAFEFDEVGRVVRSPVFDRIRGKTNTLAPYLDDLNRFAEASDFRAFYAAHRDLYEAQIAYYRDSADVAGMRRWLEGNFPDQRPYDTYNVVFSPLVAYNQSSAWFESNGFSELQPHINYPYPADFERWLGSGVSDEALSAYRGNIAFTEINHGYIDPEADRYAERVRRAISDRDRWVDPAKGPGYYGGIEAFNEYMNWALVNLRLADLLPEDEAAPLIAAVERNQAEDRGFVQFPAFSQFLVPLYRNRAEGQTLADLYPKIIAWFEAHNG